MNSDYLIMFEFPENEGVQNCLFVLEDDESEKLKQFLVFYQKYHQFCDFLYESDYAPSEEQLIHALVEIGDGLMDKTFVGDEDVASFNQVLADKYNLNKRKDSYGVIFNYKEGMLDEFCDENQIGFCVEFKKDWPNRIYCNLLQRDMLFDDKNETSYHFVFDDLVDELGDIEFYDYWFDDEDGMKNAPHLLDGSDALKNYLGKYTGEDVFLELTRFLMGHNHVLHVEHGGQILYYGVMD